MSFNAIVILSDDFQYKRIFLEANKLSLHPIQSCHAALCQLKDHTYMMSMSAVGGGSQRAHEVREVA